MQSPLRISLLLAFSCETIIITVDFTSSDHRCISYKYLTLFNFCLQYCGNSLSTPAFSILILFCLHFSECFWLLLFVFVLQGASSEALIFSRLSFCCCYNCSIIWWCINYTLGLYQNVQTWISVFLPQRLLWKILKTV